MNVLGDIRQMFLDHAERGMMSSSPDQLTSDSAHCDKPVSPHDIMKNTVLSLQSFEKPSFIV